MNKSIIAAALAVTALASCNTDTKDSYQTQPYPEYNLIVDNQDYSQLAQVSYCDYSAKYNLSRNVMDITATDIVVDNEKYSFETDEMQVGSEAVKLEGTDGYLYNLVVSKSGQTATGSIASDLNGKFVWYYWPTNADPISPYYNVTLGQRLDMRYTLDNRYSVQTFWPVSFYKGLSNAYADGESYSNKTADYMANIDFKNKKATVYVYNPEFSGNQPTSFPKVICFDEIPVVFTHEGFSLEASAPKTTILGKDSNNKAVMVDSVGFAATDFSLYFLSQDKTDISLSYKLDGKAISFTGSSILK